MLRCVVEQKDPDVFTLRVTQIKKILLMLMTVSCDKQCCAGDQETQLVIRNLELYNLPHRSDDNIHLFSIPAFTASCMAESRCASFHNHDKPNKRISCSERISLIRGQRRRGIELVDKPRHI